MSETKTFEELFLSYSQEENLKVNHLKILIINNINSNYMYLIKLKEWQIKHQEYFDYLLFIGNFLSHSENKDKNDIKEICNDEAEIGALLSYLENLSLNIVYIGGENDTPTIFKEPYPSLTLKSINLHKKFHKIAEDLYLIGYGGNIDIDSLEKVFYNFKNYIKENVNMKNIQTIFISNDNSRCDDYSLFNNKKDKINENIIKNDNNVFLNINGNIDMKKGTEKIENITILYPGSICQGEFTILILERNNNNKNSWEIKAIDYLII